MCKEEELEAPGRMDAAAGEQCTLQTPAVRHQLQICLVSVETMSALDLPLEAHRCVLSIKRAVDLLVKELMCEAPRQIADSCRLFR